MNSFIYLKRNIKKFQLEENEVGIIKENLDNDLSSKIYFLRTQEEVILCKDDYEKFDITKTGEGKSHKVCDRCFKRLNFPDKYSTNRHKKGNKIVTRPSCKSCRKIKDGKSIPSAEKRRWEALKPKDYELFICPVCNKTNIMGLKKIVLDHNHQTGEVRGYVCESCNTGMGRFDDNPDILHKVKDWLVNN
tara:strand:+ start:536 stop:1105 length:570 start_codon:yes stop_codon:yes gene_type:complete